jgi:hypothetical protein
VVRLEAVIETNDSNFVVATAYTRGLDVQKTAAVSEVLIEPPALGRGEAVVEVTCLAAVLNGLVELPGYASLLPSIFWPILEVKLQVIPGENTPAPEVDLGPGADVGEV